MKTNKLAVTDVISEVREFSKSHPRLTKTFVTTGMVLSLSVVSAFSVHTMDTAIAETGYNEVQLEDETKEKYVEQIQSFIQYDDMGKLSWRGAYNHRGRTYVHVFDGYVENIFVFEDGKLQAIGSNVTSEFVSIDSLSTTIE